MVTNSMIREGRRQMDDRKVMCKRRIKAINVDRTLTASAVELQGRADVQAQNDAITLWSEE